MSTIPGAYTQFAGNISFYNEPMYREASRKVDEAHKLLMALGMSPEQSYSWIKGWLYEAEGD